MGTRAHYKDDLTASPSGGGSLAPLVGATVDVFKQGTTTPITGTIYSADSPSGATLSNPIVLGSSVSTLEFWLASEARIDLRISKTGYTTRTITVDVLVPNPSWENVRIHGAVGDGVTDDTTAIQAALDALGSAGGTVYFPPGKYLLTAGLSSTKPNLTLLGAGGVGRNTTVGDPAGTSEILVADGTVGFTFGDNVSQIFRGPTIRNLHFRSASGAATANTAGIKIWRTSNFVLDSVACSGFNHATGGYGILIDGGSSTTEMGELRDVRTSDCTIGVDVVSHAGLCIFGGYLLGNATGTTITAGRIGLRLRSNASSNRLFGTNVQFCEVGIDVTGDSNVLIAPRLEGNTTNLRFNSGASRNGLLGCSISNSIIANAGTGISVEAGAEITSLFITYLTSVTTRISDSGTQTFTFDPVASTPGLILPTTAGVATIQFGSDVNLYRPNIADRLKTDDRFTAAGGVDTRVVATGSLPAAAASMDGHVLIEDAGAGDRNLIIYAGGERFRIDGGAAF